MATLSISMNSDNSVRIEPVGEISNADWENVIDWWSYGVNKKYHLTHVDVSISDFSQRKLWLRENWKSLGNELDIDAGVVKALKSVDGLMERFIDLSERREIDTDKFDFNAIKLTNPLTKFQERNLVSLIDMPNGANFSVPGAGKTLTTLAVWEHFRVLQEVGRLLVICPRSAFEAWETDIKMLSRQPTINQFSDGPIDPSTEILYVNYEQLENNRRLSRLINWMDQKPTMLVIDEAHRIKGGGSSIRWRACRELANHSKRVDLLTGTPMPQSQEDLRNLLTLSWKILPREFFSDSRLRSLKRGGIFVRTTKKELELPPMKITRVELKMSKVQKDIYSALKRSYLGQFTMSESDGSYFARRGKAVMTMIAVATHPGLLMGVVKEDAYLGMTWPPRELIGSEPLMKVLENYASHEIPAKYEWVIRFVEKASNEGKKVLIWSTFIANLIALKRLLARYDPALIYGSIGPDERKSELKRFRTSKSCSVLLSNPQTLGEGVSLHKDCHDAIYLDRNYNAGLYLQSLDRIHRLGLESNQETNIFVLESVGSIDQRIARRLQDKIERLGIYLNDTGLVEVSLPSVEDEILPEALMGMDELDLNDLYQHLKEDD
jgi:SNF2 family DNA or RNA helicase